MMICGQLRSCELKFGSVVNLWLVEQVMSKNKIEIAKLVLFFFFFFFFFFKVTGLLLSYQVLRRYFRRG